MYIEKRMDVLKFKDVTIAVEILEKEGYPLEDILMMCRINNTSCCKVNIKCICKELDILRSI